MAPEGMTPDERLWAAIRLERPDRVPVLPTLLPEPAAGLTGRSQAAVARDGETAVTAVFEVFDAHGVQRRALVELQQRASQLLEHRVPHFLLHEADPGPPPLLRLNSPAPRATRR